MASISAYSLKLGVLLVNTGTADSPDEDAIRRFLDEMLSDRILISAPSVIWRRVLDYVILPRRPQKNLPRYREFWTPEGSPFMLDSHAMVRAVGEDLLGRGLDAVVELAMRYGNPSIKDALARLAAAGCDQLVIVPLYPQETIACAGTVFGEVDRCMDALVQTGWQPHVSKVASYYENAAYREALAQSVRAHWTPSTNSRLAVSFHSVPTKFLDDGDPYKVQTEQTAKWLAEALGLESGQWMVTFQSRFDNRKWLGPMLPTVLAEWAEEGVKDVCVVCPGFSADCLETSIEVGKEAGAGFLELAGERSNYIYVPALADDPGNIQAIVEEIVKHV